LALKILTLPANTVKTLKNGVNVMIVSAGSDAIAKLAAAAKYSGDSAWSDAVVTDIADVAANATGALVGWRFKIAISGPDLNDSVTVTGVASTADVLDEIGTALATALNALALIAGAAYATATQILTVAETTDSLGDHVVQVFVYPPVESAGGVQSNADVDMSSVFVASVVDEGAAGDALTVTFNADTTVVPRVVGYGRQ